MNEQPKILTKAWRLACMAFDQNGEQMPEFQGPIEDAEAIRKHGIEIKHGELIR